MGVKEIDRCFIGTCRCVLCICVPCYMLKMGIPGLLICLSLPLMKSSKTKMAWQKNPQNLFNSSNYLWGQNLLLRALAPWFVVNYLRGGQFPSKMDKRQSPDSQRPWVEFIHLRNNTPAALHITRSQMKLSCKLLLCVVMAKKKENMNQFFSSAL